MRPAWEVPVRAEMKEALALSDVLVQRLGKRVQSA